MIPYSRPKRSDLYTPYQSKLPENHTLHSGTYLYSAYMAIHPLPRGGGGMPQGNPRQFWILDYFLWIPDSLSLELEFRILIVR